MPPLTASGAGSQGTRDSLSPTIHAAGSAGWPTGSQASAPPVSNGDGPGDQVSSSTMGRSARVLYDYDAADIRELSLIADEVIA